MVPRRGAGSLVVPARLLMDERCPLGAQEIVSYSLSEANISKVPSLAAINTSCQSLK